MIYNGIKADIVIRCCGQEITSGGHLSLRGSAGATCTQIGFECKKCFKRYRIVDEWQQPTQADLNAIDDTP